MSRHARHEPTAVQGILLTAALCAPDRAAPVWAEARPWVERIEQLDPASRRLLPQAYLNLRRAGVGVGDPLLARMGTIYRYTAFRNERLFEAGARAIRQLHAAGVETLVFKGVPLSILHHRDPGARPMSDLDLHVRSADTERAAGVLESAGWLAKEGEDRPLEQLRRLTHSYPYCNGKFEIDLHWYPLHEPVDVAPFWDAAVTVTVAGLEARALCATDELLVSVAHGLLSGSGVARWVADALVLLRTSGDGIDWTRMVDLARAFGLTARLEHGLHLLASRFDADVPREVLDALARSPRPIHERAAHLAAMGPPRRGRETVISWDRYRRLRGLDAHVAGISFPHYLREVVDASSWRQFARLYGRRPAHRRPGRARSGARPAVGATPPPPS